MHQSHPPADRGSPSNRNPTKASGVLCGRSLVDPRPGERAGPAGVHGQGRPKPPAPPAPPPHLAHLQLEESPLLLHLLGDLSPTYLSADHAVQLGMLLLLLFYFGSRGEESKGTSDASARCSRLDDLAVVLPPSLRDKCSPSLLETHDSPITYWKGKYIWS